MERKNNFTLAFDNQVTEDMLRTFMSCQICNTVSTKTKLLKCTHTICMKCVMMVRRKHQNPGEWTVKCVVCSGVTFCMGEAMEGLQSINTVQKLVEKATKTSQSLMSGKQGYYPSRSDDVSVNIVSAKREKQEIQRVWETAQTKMRLCHDQAKQVKVYERKVQQAKTKVKTQIKESVEAYISAIRNQEEQLLEDLDKLFQDDFNPVKEANNCIAMQMQSFRLVTECCTVAGKILKGGGAPMEMDNFKAMVKQSMVKINNARLPPAVKKAYKSKVFYKSNQHEFDELAERLGRLDVRREKKSEKKISPIYEREQQPTSTFKEEKEEPIYDLPPEWETLKRMLKDENESTSNEGQHNEQESIYDEIPVYHEESQGGAREEETDSSDGSETVPPPVKKDHPRGAYTEDHVPRHAPIDHPTDDAVSALHERRKAMRESESDFNYDSFSDDTDDE